MTIIILSSESNISEEFNQFLKSMKSRKYFQLNYKSSTQFDTQISIFINQVKNNNDLNSNQEQIDYVYFVPQNLEWQEKNMINSLDRNTRIYQGTLKLLFQESNFQQAQQIQKQLLNIFKQVEMWPPLIYIELNKDQEDQIVNSQPINVDHTIQQNSQCEPNRVALFIGNEDRIRNELYKQVLSINFNQKQTNQCFLNQWILINTLAFNMDVDGRDQYVKQFQDIFSQYIQQITTFLFILPYERTDLVKQTFTQMFKQFKYFKTKIVVLIINEKEDNFQGDSILDQFFENIVKINHIRYISKGNFANVGYLQNLLKNILENQDKTSEMLQISDLKNTIFEIICKEEQFKQQEEMKMVGLKIEKEISLNSRKTLESEISQINEKMDKLNSDEDRLKQENEQLKKKIKENNDLISEGSQKKKKLKKDIDDKQRELKRLNQDISSIEKQQNSNNGSRLGQVNQQAQYNTQQHNQQQQQAWINNNVQSSGNRQNYNYDQTNSNGQTKSYIQSNGYGQINNGYEQDSSWRYGSSNGYVQTNYNNNGQNNQQSDWNNYGNQQYAKNNQNVYNHSSGESKVQTQSIGQQKNSSAQAQSAKRKY